VAAAIAKTNQSLLELLKLKASAGSFCHRKATPIDHTYNNILSSAKYLWLQSGGFQLVIYKCFLKQIT
jgi:hypothetical protein